MSASPSAANHARHRKLRRISMRTITLAFVILLTYAFPSSGAVAAVNRCDIAWSKCNANSMKCQNQGRCMVRCDQKYAACKA